MRKVKLQIQMSLDGFIAGPQHEMDWMTFDWGDDIKAYVRSIMENVDSIFLGRNLAEGFIPHWSGLLSSPDTDIENKEAARFMVETPKYVFTGRQAPTDWAYTEIIQGDLRESVEKIRALEGQDIMVYGGAKLISSLLKENLIDELHLFVNPIALGAGLPIFAGMDQYVRFKLKKAQSFDCGITVLNYDLKK